MIESGMSCKFDRKALLTDSIYKKSKSCNKVFWCDLLKIERENIGTCVNIMKNSLKGM